MKTKVKSNKGELKKEMCVRACVIETNRSYALGPSVSVQQQQQQLSALLKFRILKTRTDGINGGRENEVFVTKITPKISGKTFFRCACLLRQ